MFQINLLMKIFPFILTTLYRLKHMTLKVLILMSKKSIKRLIGGFDAIVFLQSAHDQSIYQIGKYRINMLYNRI